MSSLFRKLALVILAIYMVASTASATELLKNYESYKETLPEIERSEWKTDVYDLSFVAYDAAFAEEFGLLKDHVEELDEGLRYINVQMITEGSDTKCYYTVMLDKSVELDFPEEDMVDNIQNPLPTLPADFNAPKESLRKSVHLRSMPSRPAPYQEYYGKTYIANLGYKFNKRGVPYSNGWQNSLGINNFIQSRDIEQNIIALHGCSNTEALKHPDLAIWVPKKGAPQSAPTPETHHAFRVPQSIVDELLTIRKLNETRLLGDK